MQQPALWLPALVTLACSPGPVTCLAHDSVSAAAHGAAPGAPCSACTHAVQVCPACGPLAGGVCVAQQLRKLKPVPPFVFQTATLDALDAGLTALGSCIPGAAREAVAKALVAQEGRLLQALAASVSTPGYELHAARTFACVMTALGPEVVSDAWQPSSRGPPQPRALANALLSVASHTFVARSDAVRAHSHTGWRVFMASLGGARKLAVPKRLAMVLQPVLAELQPGAPAGPGRWPTADGQRQALATWRALLDALHGDTPGGVLELWNEAVSPVLQALLSGARPCDPAVASAALRHASDAARDAAQAKGGAAAGLAGMAPHLGDLCALLRRMPPAVWTPDGTAAPPGGQAMLLLLLTWLGASEAGPTADAVLATLLATLSSLAATDTVPVASAALLGAVAAHLASGSTPLLTRGSPCTAAKLLTSAAACASRLGPADGAGDCVAHLLSVAQLLARSRGGPGGAPGAGILEAAVQLLDAAFGDDAGDVSTPAAPGPAWSTACSLAVEAACALGSSGLGDRLASHSVRIVDLLERATLAVDNAARGAQMRVDGSQDASGGEASQQASATMGAARDAGARLRAVLQQQQNLARAAAPQAQSPFQRSAGKQTATAAAVAQSPRSLFAAVTAANAEADAVQPSSAGVKRVSAVVAQPSPAPKSKAAAAATPGKGGKGKAFGSSRRGREDDDSQSAYVRIEAQPSQQGPAVLTEHQREVRDAQRRGAVGTYTALDPGASQDASQATFARLAGGAVAPASFVGILVGGGPRPAPAAPVAAPIAPPVPPAAALPPPLQGAPPSKRVRFAEPEPVAAAAMPPPAPPAPVGGPATQEGAAVLAAISASASAEPLCPQLAGEGHPARDMALDKLLSSLPRGLSHVVAGTGVTSVGALAALPHSAVAGWPRDGADIVRRALTELAHSTASVTPSRGQATSEPGGHAAQAAAKPRAGGASRRSGLPSPGTPAVVSAASQPGSLLAQELAKLEASPLWSALDAAGEPSAPLVAAQGTLLGLASRVNSMLARHKAPPSS